MHVAPYTGALADVKNTGNIQSPWNSMEKLAHAHTVCTRPNLKSDQTKIGTGYKAICLPHDEVKWKMQLALNKGYANMAKPVNFDPKLKVAIALAH